MQLAHPQYLWLFLVFIPLIVWYIFKQRNAKPSMAVSTISPFAKTGTSYKSWLRHALFILRLGAIGCVIIILARPQIKDNWRTTSTEGTDIMLAMDISTSMLARDFKPDRLEAAKDVAQQFVSARDNDNIGIVIFAGESLTGIPMTVDHAPLQNYIAGIQTEMVTDGTAIGDGIATSLNRLKEGKAKSRSIILLTDGSNNTGVVSPMTAAEIAKEMGVKIYTIGIGTNGNAPFPTIDMFGRVTYSPQPVVIDESTLKQIAQTTGGQYFRATNKKVLQEIFSEIDQLEKTQMDIRHFSHTEDNYMTWAWLAFAFVCIDLLLRYTILRTIP